MLFKSRIQQLLVLFVFCWLLVVGRLFHLQVVNADYYSAQANRKLISDQRALEALRGRIIDRHGHQLAADAPSWNIALHYRLLDRKCPPDNVFIDRLAERWMPDFDEQGPDQARQMLQDLWNDIAAIAQCPVEKLDEIARNHVDTIAAWKDAYYRQNHVYIEMREERECHPLATGLTAQQHVDVQMLLKNQYGWLVDAGAVRLTDSSARRYERHPAVAHLLGNMREASRADLERRPYRAGGHIVDHGGYRLGDRHGRSGIELSHEGALRGTRGHLVQFRDGRDEERQQAVDGQDVALTIDFELQSAVHDILAAKVDDTTDEQNIPGGSVVVLDVATREILAMVSYPAYDITTFRSTYNALLKDTIGRPIVHRAVQQPYPPGSIVKPITVAAGWDVHVLSSTKTLECTGRLSPNSNSFKCWRPTGQTAPRPHGVITGEEAIMRSCNVFCYKTGDLLRERMGTAGAVEHMCAWMSRVGIGQPTGIQIDENTGTLPTPQWLHDTRNRKTSTSDPRNFAIGQGEVEVTPLQAANIVATYASGMYLPVTLVLGEGSLDAERVLPVPVWQVIRRGMYRVVNDSDGTSKGSRLKSTDYCLCGKSGSAQAVPLTTSMIVGIKVDDIVVASAEYQTDSLYDARRDFLAAHPEFEHDDVRILARTRWPELPGGGRSLSHAWFVAFIQPTADGKPDWRITAPIAIAVLLEFGDSGGRVAGPVCRDVADAIIDLFPHYVTTGGSITR